MDMTNFNFKPFLKHIIALVVFAAIALVYFYPASFNNKVIGNQVDRTQSIARKHELKKYTESENSPILWTHAIFSGMPSTLIGAGEPNTYHYVNLFTLNIFRFFSKSTVPYALFFGGFLGMYILLLVCRVDYKLAIFGAILYGLSTSHLLVLQGGHFNKLQNLILCPPFMAAVITLLRGRRLIGFTFTALMASVMLLSAHVQIVFYFVLVLAIYVIIRLIDAYKDGSIKDMSINVGILLLAGFLALMPNAFKMWSLKSYGDESIRGKTELVSDQKPSEGLSKDYAFSWSMGIMESMSVLVPDMMGATSSAAFVSDPDSESLKALRGNPNANQLAQYSRKYWGDQPFVGGAYYYGAVLIFLFLMAMWTVPLRYRWWSLGGMLLIFMIGWGRNFSSFNFFLFDHMPLFNKFRAVNMIFNLGHILICLIAMMGLDRLLKMKQGEAWNAIKKGGIASAAIMIFALVVSYVVDPSAPSDAAIANQTKFLEALQADRLSIMRADIFRSIIYMAIPFTILYFWQKKKISSNVSVVIICALALIDIISVNVRYVNESHFVKKQNYNRQFELRPVDKEILKDSDIHYRVMDLSSGDPFNTNISAYHHKLVGGYHPAKIRRYQDIIERYLSNPQKYIHVFSMLNTKYFIQKNNQGQDIVIPNQESLGNAWFVENVQTVKNANQEIDALASFDPAKTAIMQEKWAEGLSSKTYGSSAGSSVKLTKFVPDHLTYEYSSDQNRLMVFSEIYYPEYKGWKVYIDGKEYGGLRKANYVLNSVEVPAGKHKLELRFEPNNWNTFLWISRVGSIILSLLVLYSLFLVFKPYWKGAPE